MTTLNIDDNSAAYQIRAYQPGEIKINDLILTHSLIITPQELIENWGPEDVELLSADMLLPELKIKPDLLIIGTGAELVFISPEIYGHLINQGIGVEVMSTRAACKTYTVLSSENRNLAAALIL